MFLFKATSSVHRGHVDGVRPTQNLPQQPPTGRAAPPALHQSHNAAPLPGKPAAFGDVSPAGLSALQLDDPAVVRSSPPSANSSSLLGEYAPRSAGKDSVPRVGRKTPRGSVDGHSVVDGEFAETVSLPRFLCYKFFVSRP